MKQTKPPGKTSVLRGAQPLLCGLVVAAALFGAGNRLQAAPRPPGPPLPETGAIFRARFDEPLRWPTNQVIDSSIWVESWSGYALSRQPGATVAPWVVPLLATNGACRVDPARGALRLWYMPAWSSAATGQGSGPGNLARLLTLVSTNGSTSAMWWSLVVSEDGDTVSLVCQTEAGPAACLAAPVSFQAGTWHCLAIGYTTTNSALFIDGQQVAAGTGLAAVPVETLPFTSLVIGSSLSGSGSEVAAGQLEEFTAFTAGRRLQEIAGHEFGLDIGWEIGGYYSNRVQLAASGPISAQEEAARQQMWAQRLAALQAGGLASPMQSSPGDSPVPAPSWCGTNDIYTVWLTNIVVWSNAEGGWNTSLSIGGGTNGARYDLFCTTNLSGDSITNMPWVWVTNGYACDTIVLTNQPGTAAFYVLGTPVDSDGDSLTDAYELLVSKTNPNLFSTDGSGMSDRWEILIFGHTGIDPNGPFGDGLTNYQEYMASGGSGDNFSLVLTEPKPCSNLP